MRARRGLTLVELILAIGLFALLLVAVLQLLDGSLGMWERTETRRDLQEIGGAAGELLARDLGAVEGSADGDLVCYWKRNDANGDGLAAGKWPVLLLKRQAGAQERVNLRADWPADLPDRGLVEVAWMVVPSGAQPERAPGIAADPRMETGVLVREAQLVGEPKRPSLFSVDAFDKLGRPQFEPTEVASGVLWLALSFAGGGASLADGWKMGPERTDCQSAWDAWGRGRPDGSVHAWNEAPRWIEPTTENPTLPRRVRIELEVERPRDLKRRPKLTAILRRDEAEMLVDSTSKLPAMGELVMIGEEWLRVRSIDGRRVSVSRGERATLPGEHGIGSTVHFGERFLRDVPVVLRRQEWDL